VLHIYICVQAWPKYQRTELECTWRLWSVPLVHWTSHCQLLPTSTSLPATHKRLHSLDHAGVTPMPPVSNGIIKIFSENRACASVLGTQTERKGKNRVLNWERWWSPSCWTGRRDPRRAVTWRSTPWRYNRNPGLWVLLGFNGGLYLPSAAFPLSSKDRRRAVKGNG